MRVFKFGGASVKDANAILNMANIVSGHRDEPLVMVVSAMGKTTNALEEVVEAYYRREQQSAALLQAIKETHLAVINQLGLGDGVGVLVNDIFVEAEWLLEDDVQDSYDYIYDQVVAIGELAATRIVEGQLRQQGLQCCWLDARDLVKTDDSFREAVVDWDKTKDKVVHAVSPRLDQGQLVLTQGFIGGTQDNYSSTLGREGSDYSAAILGACLGATSVVVWKDVPGIMTGDPRRDPTAELLPRLSYEEAIEMTYYGAKVIHPKTLRPLREANIPMEVRSFARPDHVGTTVATDDGITYPPITVVINQLRWIHFISRDLSFIMEEHLGTLFQRFAAARVKIHFMKNLATSFSVCVDDDPRHFAMLQEELSHDFAMECMDNVELVTVRHYDEDTMQRYRRNGQVLLEEWSPTTVQFILQPDQ